jgi:hypothetical protein
MPVFRQQENIITKERDLDKVAWRLTPDRIIQTGSFAFPSRRSHNYMLWTTLDESLMPKAAITSLTKCLDILSSRVQEQTSKNLINILINCRDYIDIYFNATKTHPSYISSFDKWSKDIAQIKKTIASLQSWIAYLWNDVRSEKMQYQVALTSLSLREIIINTVWLREVAHFPSQVKNKLDNFKLRAFLLDSHCRWEEWKGIIDCRDL